MSVDKWEQRLLCPDGACVGVISMNGTCKVCGTVVPDWGDPRKPGRVSSKAEADEPQEPEPPHDDDDEDDEDDEDDADGATAEAEPGDETDDDIAKRKLCSDGGCIGVIGANGKCKVCGKAADGSHDDEDEDDDDGDDDEDDDVDETDQGGDVDTAAAGAKPNDVPKSAKPDEDRALCPDGACVGLIGDDGKCKVCGKAAA